MHARTRRDTHPKIDAVDRNAERRIERPQQPLAEVVRQGQQPSVVPARRPKPAARTQLRRDLVGAQLCRGVGGGRGEAAEVKGQVYVYV